jgi:hypothetical protein
MVGPNWLSVFEEGHVFGKKRHSRFKRKFIPKRKKASVRKKRPRPESYGGEAGPNTVKRWNVDHWENQPAAKRPRYEQPGDEQAPPPSSVIPTKMPTGKKYSRHVIPTYAGRFRRPRRVKRKNIYALSGAQVKVDSGPATASGVAACELGHSVCAPFTIGNCVSKALFRRLWKWESITQWIDNSAFTTTGYDYTIIYRTAPNVAPVSTAPAAFVSSTFHIMADEIMNSILQLVTSTNDLVSIESINVKQTADPGVNNVIDLKTAKLKIYMSSRLVAQNLTESDTAGTDDHTHVTDIRANPLRGRSYETNSNMIMYTNDKQAGLLADSRYSYIVNEPSVELGVQSKRHYSNVVKTAEVRLAPGGLKRSDLKKTMLVNFNKYLGIFRQWNEQNGRVDFAFLTPTDTFLPLGPSRHFIFEHALKHGGDPNVLVGYETNYFVSAVLYSRKNRMAERFEL